MLTNYESFGSVLGSRGSLNFSASHSLHYSYSVGQSQHLCDQQRTVRVPANVTCNDTVQLSPQTALLRSTRRSGRGGGFDFHFVCLLAGGCCLQAESGFARRGGGSPPPPPHAHGLASVTFCNQCYAPVVVLMYELLRVVEPVHCYGFVAPSAVVIDIWQCRQMCNGILHV
jgi:hypothetical protein